MTIPRTIHYCWFGGRPHAASMVKWMNSWRRLLPDYRIVEWNETNFDVSSVPYTREAYSAERYAFVTDVVRLHVLYEHGGIYMDTDVEVLRPLDRFLSHEAFSGFEDDLHIPTGIMGSRRGNVWIGALLSDYEGRHFLREEGEFDLTTNTTRISQISEADFGIRLDNALQEVPGVVTLYPSDYFCPKSHSSGVIRKTSNTHTIHHFAGSWLPAAERDKLEREAKWNRLLGKRMGERVVDAQHVLRREGVAALVGRAGRHWVQGRKGS